jgi:hypothetical protein
LYIVFFVHGTAWITFFALLLLILCTPSISIHISLSLTPFNSHNLVHDETIPTKSNNNNNNYNKREKKHKKNAFNIHACSTACFTWEESATRSKQKEDYDELEQREYNNNITHVHDHYIYFLYVLLCIFSVFYSYPPRDLIDKWAKEEWDKMNVDNTTQDTWKIDGFRIKVPCLNETCFFFHLQLRVDVKTERRRDLDTHHTIMIMIEHKLGSFDNSLNTCCDPQLFAYAFLTWA